MNVDVIVGALWGFGMGVLLTIRLLVLRRAAPRPADPTKP